MPTDFRRITGPVTSRTPYSFLKNSEEKFPHNVKDKRTDCRTDDQMRPIFLRAGIISQARGSAYIELNQTKVICAVYGPREIARKEEFSMKGQLTCEIKFATFSCKVRGQHQQDSREKDLSLQLLEALEPAVCMHKFPKAQVNVYVTVIQNDGSALAAAITSSSVALADAGIEMYDLVLGCSVRLIGDRILLDPCDAEFKSETNFKGNSADLCMGYLPNLNQISALTSKGECSMDLVSQGIRKCVDSSQKMYPIIKRSLLKSKLKTMEMESPGQ